MRKDEPTSKHDFVSANQWRHNSTIGWHIECHTNKDADLCDVENHNVSIDKYLYYVTGHYFKQHPLESKTVPAFAPIDLIIEGRPAHTLAYVIRNGYTIDMGVASVGPGWSNLVRSAFIECPSDLIIVQVKEKFGGLRIYTDPKKQYSLDVGPQGSFDSDVHKAYQKFLNELEVRSTEVCEYCAAKCKIQKCGTSLIKAICDDCLKRRADRGY